MKNTALKRIYAALLLLILLCAQTGQKVHIYREDLRHFVAFSGALVPDNGADCQVVERCVVDDFCFFPFLEYSQPAHVFFAQMLAVLHAAPHALQAVRGAARRLAARASGGLIFSRYFLFPDSPALLCSRFTRNL